MLETQLEVPIFEPLPLILLTQMIVMAGLAVVARVRASRDPRIGRPYLVIQDSGRLKPALLALQTGLLIITLVADPFPTLYAAFALLGAILLTWLSPGADDRACGEDGVYRGWYGRRYSELEEWRLTGDHLRFRLRGEWTSVEVPALKRAHIRMILQEAIPDRESRFRD